MKQKDVAVSVRCTTYNHVKYIRQCLDGFIMQQTNFKFEVIVHDDASTDGTTEIVREYAEKYPRIIKPMYETDNQYSKNLTAMNEAINSLLIGKYVAICEGDDYWTDPLKLQKQFDFMESHPDYSLCFHPHSCLYPNGNLVQSKTKKNKTDWSVKDFIWRGGEFVATNSMFFPRKYYLQTDERPDFWKDAIIGDVPLLLFLALNGKVGCLNEYQSVYRMQVNGSWTSGNRSKSFLLSSTKSALQLYNQFDEFTNGQYRKYVIIKKIRIIIRYVRGLLRILGGKIIKMIS